MKRIERVVVDTNVLVSRLLFPDSVPGRVIRAAVQFGTILVSDSTIEELTAVLSRPKFDPYLSVSQRQEFIRLLGSIAQRIPTTCTIRACRDPRDDKFLELAVSGRADVIVTGDQDLLDLNPFHGIPIIIPSEAIKLNFTRS
jgi:putative PIN family toxin of toxin-antitoxin system